MCPQEHKKCILDTILQTGFNKYTYISKKSTLFLVLFYLIHCNIDSGIWIGFWSSFLIFNVWTKSYGWFLTDGYKQKTMKYYAIRVSVFEISVPWSDKTNYILWVYCKFKHIEIWEIMTCNWDLVIRQYVARKLIFFSSILMISTKSIILNTSMIDIMIRLFD